MADPYPYLEALQARCPVSKEPHHNVWMVTGWEEASEVAGDADRFSSCIAVTGPPFPPGFPPVPPVEAATTSPNSSPSTATSFRSSTSYRRWIRRCTPITGLS